MSLAGAYDRVCQSELQPLPYMAHDDVRAIAEALNLPTGLREGEIVLLNVDDLYQT
jgi:hypothetical protein